jgi:hypothetical protein
MNDIVTRLRRWTHAVDAVSASDLMDEAAKEIEGLREVSGRPKSDVELLLARIDSSQRTLIFEQEAEIARLRLTDSERDVLREVCRVYADQDDVECNEISFVIDRILGRLGPAANSTPIPRTGCGESESRTGSDGETAVEDVAKCSVKSAKCPERERLTDAEREAIELSAEYYIYHQNPKGQWVRTAATLRSLLERTK